MTYTKYPQASKALMAFMRRRQLQSGLEGAQGYLTHCLNATTPIRCGSDPKRTIFGQAGSATLTAGGLGSVGGEAADRPSADFLCSNVRQLPAPAREDVKGAMAVAEARQADPIGEGGATPSSFEASHDVACEHLSMTATEAEVTHT